MGIEIDQTTLTFTPDMTPGQAAYEQFCEDVVALPIWENVTKARKLTWERAAQAAINKHQETCCCDCTPVLAYPCDCKPGGTCLNCQ